MRPVLYHTHTRLVTLLALLLAVLGPAMAFAQPSDEPPGLPETIAAYDLLEPWVRALGVPDDATGPELIGACVTLRFEGRAVGVGTIFGAGTRSLPDAARIAIAQARNKLPITRDAMAEERLGLAAQQLTISLELAGPGVPMQSRTQADLVANFSPGIHGVALRFGDLAAAIYPGEMLWTSQDVPGAVRRLIAGVTGDQALSMRPIEEVLEGADMRVLRFRTRHIAQLEPRGEARLLQRGGRFVQSAEVRSMQALREWADGVGAFLIAHRDVGIYLPVNDTIRSTPSPLQRALRMYALTSLASITTSADLATQAHAEAAHDAGAILSVWESGEPIGAAVVSLVAVGLEDGFGEDARFAEAKVRLRAELSRLASDIESVPVPERPMVAWALAKLARFEEARAIMPVCRRADHPGQLVERMPWLGLAELELVGAEGVASAPALREMREMMWRLQITRADVQAADSDLVGGIVFNSSLTRLPTWQIARPLAFTAPMLAEPTLTEPGERPAEMARLFEALRFLRQLSAGEHESHMFVAGGSWLWGVRPAPWDQSMPVETSAMALICLCQTIQSLERLEGQIVPQEPAQTGSQTTP